MKALSNHTARIEAISKFVIWWLTRLQPSTADSQNAGKENFHNRL